jgi:hypothetical protein
MQSVAVITTVLPALLPALTSATMVPAAVVGVMMVRAIVEVMVLRMAVAALSVQSLLPTTAQAQPVHAECQPPQPSQRQSAAAAAAAPRGGAV